MASVLSVNVVAATGTLAWSSALATGDTATITFQGTTILITSTGITVTQAASSPDASLPAPLPIMLGTP